MAAPRFLAKSDFSNLRPLRHNGVLVLDGYPTISALLARQGEQLSHLLAEPVMGSKGPDGPRLVSWYGVYDGEAKPLTQLNGPAREAAETQLRDTLHRLRPLLTDPVSGGMLGKAIVVPSLDSVMVADGRIILVNWATVASNVADDPADLSRHWDATLGPYASFPAPWELQAEPPSPARPELQTVPPPPDSAADSPRRVRVGPTASAPLAAEAAVAAAAALPWYQRGRTWVIGSTLLFLLGLLLGLLLLGFAPLGSAEDVSPDQLALQNDINNTLLQQIGRLRGALQGDVCKATQPLGSEGLNAPVKPLDDGRQAVTIPEGPGKSGPGQPPQHPSLATLLDKAAVLVVVRKPNGIGFGTGFFIAPNVLATNAHVVEGAQPGTVTISSKTIGGLHPVDVVAVTPDPRNGEDYAILRSHDDLSMQTAVLPLTTSISKLDPVVAAGYPAVIIEADQAFRALLENQPGGAIPDLVATRGEVAAIQTLASTGLPAIAHTAIMSQGNSGGPLIDQCGRVVGINTFIVFNAKESPRQGNYAIASSDLLKFLQGNQVAVTISDDRCSS